VHLTEAIVALRCFRLVLTLDMMVGQLKSSQMCFIAT